MKKIYLHFLIFVCSFATAQQTIFFEASEGYQLATLNLQNGWEVTEGSDGVIQNQVISNQRASQGSYSFKNAFEPSFSDQWFPIFGASKTFDVPANFSTFTISYDVLATQKMGSDFEFTLFAIDENDEYVPVAGVGIENRGFIYLIKDVNYGFDYAIQEWEINQWTNVKIEVSATQIKYYINNVLEKTISNFTQLNIVGFNMLHNNYGADAFYDNFSITTQNLGRDSFQNQTLAVYPNPAQNVISLQTSENFVVSSVEIYSILGQKVLQTQQTQFIDLTDLSAGNYFVKVTTNDGNSITKKIIKK